MGLTTTVTIYEYYFKSIEIEIEEEYLKGLTKEEIAEKLISGDIPYDRDSVQNTELTGFTPSSEEDETDRYDIYTEEGDHTYGGHL